MCWSAAPRWRSNNLKAPLYIYNNVLGPEEKKNYQFKSKTNIET